MTKGRGNKIVLRPDQVRRAQARLKEGIGLAVVARDMGMSDTVLGRALREKGVEPNDYRFNLSNRVPHVTVRRSG